MPVRRRQPAGAIACGGPVKIRWVRLALRRLGGGAVPETEIIVVLVIVRLFIHLQSGRVRQWSEGLCFSGGLC